MEVQDLFEEYGVLSFENQLHLADLVGKSKWRFDLRSGVLVFDDFSVPVQILGTVSEYSQTWLWAWANAESNIPPPLLAASQRMRSFGEENSVVEFSEPEIDVAPFDKGHILAMIAAGLLGAAAYYRAPYEGGAAFLLIPELAQLRGTAKTSDLDVVSTFMRFISTYECNHKTTLQSYLKAKGSPPVDAVFDSKGRLVKIEARVG